MEYDARTLGRCSLLALLESRMLVIELEMHAAVDSDALLSVRGGSMEEIRTSIR